MDGSPVETILGLNGISNGALIRGFFTSATAQIIFSIFNRKLFLLNYDSLNPLGASAKPNELIENNNIYHGELWMFLDFAKQ